MILGSKNKLANFGEGLPCRFLETPHSNWGYSKSHFRPEASRLDIFFDVIHFPDSNKKLTSVLSIEIWS